jgi:hypothetical protein
MFVWICREESTLAALQGLVRTLEDQNGLRYATIKILTVNGSRGIEIPAGSRDSDGRPVGPHVFTVDNCPAGGILLLTDEEDD